MQCRKQYNKIILLFAAFLFGSVYAVGAVGIALLAKHFFGDLNYGTVYSKLSFLLSVGSASSLPLIGYLYDFTGAYSPAFLVAIGINLLNIMLISICSRWKMNTVTQESLR